MPRIGVFPERARRLVLAKTVCDPPDLDRLPFTRFGDLPDLGLARLVIHSWARVLRQPLSSVADRVRRDVVCEKDMLDRHAYVSGRKLVIDDIPHAAEPWWCLDLSFEEPCNC